MSKPQRYLCPSAAALIIKGPTEPVLDGQKIVLECQYTDSEHNITDVYFQRALKVGVFRTNVREWPCSWSTGANVDLLYCHYSDLIMVIHK